jgi:hypothetical protein
MIWYKKLKDMKQDVAYAAESPNSDYNAAAFSSLAS